ncbi:PAS domain S-box protein [Spirulina sp. CCNP1310]|uniref:PAS domain S-box protein n=1 Tax=Spirulina sp. CCNP1310 TaxID=3110249 RepID=UPI002B2183DD|nr:PAS domain S-box protein [Spirulina sp. CCNP1310]MEA5420981.1 PAS domain S-box protein [Spirulina sp. CCNP1310]
MGKPTIICVDDEQLVLASLRDSLHQALGNEYVVEIAESGEEALELITELLASATEIPLIISDQLMPGLKGDELLAEIHRYSPRTLKVMLTGQATPDAVGRAVNHANLYRYIPKPWSGLGLIEMVKSALEQYFQNQDVHEVNSVLEELNEQLEQEVQLRTAALQQHVNLEKLIAEVSTQFLNTSFVAIDEGINEALAKFGCFFRVDRSYVFRVDSTRQEVCCSHEWCGLGIQSYRDQLQNLPIIAMPWLFNQLAAGETVLIPAVADLPSVAVAERAEFQMEGIQSLICVPVMVQEQWVGFVGFDLVQSQQAWPEQVIHALRMIGELFAGVIYRQQQELSLIEKEERFRGAFDNAGIGMAILGLNNQFLQVNPKLCEMLGYTAQELKRLTFFDVTHPEDGRINYTKRQQLFRDVINSYQLEKRYITKMGEVIWVLLNVALVRDHRHQPLYYVTQVQDISDRKRMELALQNSERQMREITDAIPGVVYRYHYREQEPDYLSFISQGVEQIYEISAVEACADVNRLFAMVLPEDLPALQASIVASAQRGEPWSSEHRIRTPSGRVKWLQGRSQPSYQPDGSLVWHGIIADVTEIKQAELELEETRRRLQSLTENIPGMLYTLAQTGDEFRFLFASAGCETLFGVTQEQVLADSSVLLAHIHPDDVAGYRERVVASRVNLSHFSYEWRHVMPSGEIVWLMGNSTPHRQPDGSIHWHGLVLDVSDRKRMELALQNREQEIRDITDAVPGMVYRYHRCPDGEHYLSFVSRGVEQIYEICAEAVYENANRLFGQVIPEDIPDLYASILRSAETLEPWNFQHRICTPSGRVKWLQGRSHPNQQADGSVVWHGILTDVTDIKQAESELGETRRRLEALNANLPGMIYTMHQTGEGLRFVYVSSTCERMFGMKPEAILADPMVLVGGIHPEDLPEYERKMIEATTHLTPFSHEWRQILPSGEMIWNLVNATPDPQPDGSVYWHGLAMDVGDRKETELALRHSETRNQMMLDAIPDLMIFMDANGRYISRFSSTYTLDLVSHISDQELVQTTVLETLPPAIAQKHLDGIHHALETQTVQQFEQEFTIGDRVQYEEVRVIPYRKDRVLLIIRDISDRKQAELALQDSEAKTRAIIEALPDLLIRMRQDGCCLEVHCADYFHGIKPAQEMIGHNLREILPPAAAAQQLAATQQALATKEMQHYEYPLEFGDQKLWREVRIVPLRHNEVLIVVRDLTARKAMEESLRRSEATNRALLQAIPDILIQVNRQGQRLNIFAHDINALYNPNSIAIGGNIRDSLPPKVAEQRLQLVAQALDTGEVQAYEYTLEIAEELRYQEARIVPILDDQALVIVRDVTQQKRFELELKQAKEAAEAANVAKSSFLANMSHELRTPLNAILGFAQVMERDGNLDPQNFTNLQTILRSGDHLLALINDILDLSKIEAGRLTVDIQPIDLPNLVDSVYGLLYQRAISKGISFSVELAPDLPPFVLTDGGKVRQILVNLVGNAIKFTDHGRVRLAVTRQPTLNNPDGIRFCVEDTGIGIDPMDQERIFEAFEQTQAGTMNPDGTGLGLTITQRFVELLQGTITLASTPGQGSTFCVMLPMVATELAPVEIFSVNQRVVALAPGQPSVKVLVADDHEANRLFLVQLLGLVGFVVIEARTGEEAIAQWQTQQPDVILMDLQMPEIDGFTATRHIREQESAKQSYTPIIALTASVFPQDRNEAIEAGCDQFLSKPCPEEELFEKLADVLGLTYEYETITPDIATPPPSTLKATDLEVMPKDWIEALYQAAILCYDTQVNQLIAQIPPEQATLQKILQYHNDNFDMEPIIEAAQQFLEI